MRYPNQQVAQKIAELGCAAALNNNIGYDQNERTTYWNQLQKCGYDPSKISVLCEDDCSAGVCANVKAAGYIFGIQALKNIPITATFYMREIFRNAGFQVLTDSKYLTSNRYLLPGDILLQDNYHTCTNVTVGSAVRSSWNGSAAISTQSTTNSSVSKTSTIVLKANSTSKFTVTKTGSPNGTQKAVGKVTADELNVREWAGTEYDRIKSYPVLGQDNLVAICDSLLDKEGTTWYYVKIANKYYGFVCSDWIIEQ